LCLAAAITAATAATAANFAAANRVYFVSMLSTHTRSHTGTQVVLLPSNVTS
jgi:hypothetical protein